MEVAGEADVDLEGAVGLGSPAVGVIFKSGDDIAAGIGDLADGAQVVGQIEIVRIVEPEAACEGNVARSCYWLRALWPA